MDTKLQPNQSIIVSQKQQHLNSSVITQGELISTTGDKALVMLQGEDVIREVPLASIAAADSALGNISTPGEMPVIDMSPRKGVY